MLFFRITATQYLTALALVQDYRRHLAYSSPPPTPMLYISIPARLWLHACIRRHFWWQSSAVVFIPSELVMSAPTLQN